jgi:hypothetical protein
VAWARSQLTRLLHPPCNSRPAPTTWSAARVSRRERARPGARWMRPRSAPRSSTSYAHWSPNWNADIRVGSLPGGTHQLCPSISSTSRGCASAPGLRIRLQEPTPLSFGDLGTSRRPLCCQPEGACSGSICLLCVCVLFALSGVAPSLGLAQSASNETSAPSGCGGR